MNVYLIFVIHRSISDEYTVSFKTNTVGKYIVYYMGHVFWGVRTRESKFKCSSRDLGLLHNASI